MMYVATYLWQLSVSRYFCKLLSKDSIQRHAMLSLHSLVLNNNFALTLSRGKANFIFQVKLCTKHVIVTQRGPCKWCCLKTGLFICITTTKQGEVKFLLLKCLKDSKKETSKNAKIFNFRLTV